jgi:RNA polymerase sigma-70 factor (ECF subfamily)
MLGSPDDADDVVQETQLRWLDVDGDQVRDPEGWLVSVATRLSIDRLREARRERERYPGPWIPSPVAGTPPPAPDRAAELASDLSLAFLHLLERLEPEERAAFLLREVFEVGYGHIAEMVDRSEAACRQMVSRARRRVREGPRRSRATEEEREAMARRFLQAVEADDYDELMGLLAPDATHLTDGGGKVWAARNEIVGADRVVRGLLGVLRKARARGDGEASHRVGRVNGEPALLRFQDGRLVSVSTLQVEDGRIRAIFSVLNPDKLARLADA